MESGAAFDPEMIAIMRSALNEAWSSLGPQTRCHVSQSELAQEILRLAKRGESDPKRLCAGALEMISSIRLGVAAK